MTLKCFTYLASPFFKKWLYCKSGEVEESKTMTQDPTIRNGLFCRCGSILAPPWGNGRDRGEGRGRLGSRLQTTDVLSCRAVAAWIGALVLTGNRF